MGFVIYMTKHCQQKKTTLQCALKLPFNPSSKINPLFQTKAMGRNCVMKTNKKIITATKTRTKTKSVDVKTATTVKARIKKDIYMGLTAKGLGEALASELESLGILCHKYKSSEVTFETDLRGIYRLHLQSRIASRFIKPLSSFRAATALDIYKKISQLQWTHLIPSDGHLYVDASIRECSLKDQRLLAMKVKDAIVDQFRDKFGERPDINKSEAQLRVQIRGVKDRYDVSLDMTGESLFKRGYRKQVGEAPVKENLAAGLLAIADWETSTSLFDPMCGSGTFLIEAALKALNIAPGTLRNHFIFMEHKNFNKTLYEEVFSESLEQELDETSCEFFGSDRDRKILGFARTNAKAAGVASLIQFKKGDVTTMRPPFEKGLIVTNPPYGVRIGEEENLYDVYRDLGYTLKNHFKGWTAWILAGNKDLTAFLGMKATRRFALKNGAIDCRFIKYDVRP